MRPLSREDILHAFAALSSRLEHRGKRAEIALMGGAAMVLGYAAREATQDVDAIVLSSEPAIIRECAREVATAMEIRQDWLNDAAKGFLRGLALGKVVFATDRLVVRVIAPPQLLAMKLCAWRDERDIADAVHLVHLLGGTHDDVWNAIAEYVVVGHELKARYAFEDVWEKRHGSS